MLDSSKSEEPPDSSRSDSSQRYFSRNRTEYDLKTSARQVIRVCDMLMKGETPNGEVEYLGRLAEHLRQRVGTEGDRRTIRDTTYLNGLMEMLGRFSDVPNGATFTPELLKFAEGIEKLPQSNQEGIATYRDALTSLVDYINAQERACTSR